MYNSGHQSNSFESAYPAESTVSSQNSDDEFDNTTIMRRDRRRELHTQAEQRRRDAIKNGYDTLLPLINTNNSESNGSKLSKATILQRTISQIKTLTEQTSTKEKELDSLKNELFALKIMNSNYEEIAKCQSDAQIQSTQQSDQQQVPENVKYDIFGQFLLCLFDSFDKNTKFDDFSTASNTIIHWVEEFCKPKNLDHLVESVLTDVLSQYYSADAADSHTHITNNNNNNNNNIGDLNNNNTHHKISNNDKVTNYSYTYDQHHQDTLYYQAQQQQQDLQSPLLTDIKVDNNFSFHSNNNVDSDKIRSKILDNDNHGNKQNILKGHQSDNRNRSSHNIFPTNCRRQTFPNSHLLESISTSEFSHDQVFSLSLDMSTYPPQQRSYLNKSSLPNLLQRPPDLIQRDSIVTVSDSTTVDEIDTVIRGASLLNNNSNINIIKINKFDCDTQDEVGQLDCSNSRNSDDNNDIIMTMSPNLDLSSFLENFEDQDNLMDDNEWMS